MTRRSFSLAIQHYFFALFVSSLALFLTWVTWLDIQKVIFIFFYPAVIAASIFGGFLPGVFVIGCGVLGINLFLMPHPMDVNFDRANIVPSLAFIFLAGIVAWGCAYRRRAEERARTRAQELLEAQTELTQSRQTLEQWNRTLEEQVKTRTEELGRSREALHQAQKLEAIGRLAGGIAHDFNNLMTGILGISEELRSEIENEDHRQDIDDIIKAAQKAARLTRQLLAFGRQQIAQPVVLNLNEAVVDMGGLLARVIAEDIVVITSLEPGLKKTRIDPSQMEQILMNLVLNARDAMPKGGKITIETSNVTLNAQYTESHFDVREGNYVMLAISDTGLGMDENTLSHAFEPFFTTKAAGKGTGMGLATVHGIIKQNAGHITAYSHVGVGTTFKIYLPAVDAPEGTAPRLVRKPGERKGAETILVVEDEDLVRKVAVNALRKQGYQVLEASHGADALLLAAAQVHPIDLLLTDVVMPGMNGRELADQLQQRIPEIKVIFMSGYTQNIIVHRGILKPGIHFIEKAFTSETLTKRIRQVLDEETAPASSSET